MGKATDDDADSVCDESVKTASPGRGEEDENTDTWGEEDENTDTWGEEDENTDTCSSVLAWGRAEEAHIALSWVARSTLSSYLLVKTLLNLVNCINELVYKRCFCKEASSICSCCMPKLNYCGHARLTS